MEQFTSLSLHPWLCVFFKKTKQNKKPAENASIQIYQAFE